MMKFLVIACAIVFGFMSTAKAEKLLSKRDLVAGLQQIAKQLNAQTPIKVDRATTLQSVNSIDATLYYNYITSINVRQNNAGNFINSVKQSTKNNICSQKDIRWVFKSGGRYMYVYSNNYGETLGNFILDKNACGIR